MCPVNVGVPSSLPQYGSPNTANEISVSRDCDKFKCKYLKILPWGGVFSPKWLSHTELRVNKLDPQVPGFKLAC